jgi:hypothetical protein
LPDFKSAADEMSWRELLRFGTAEVEASIQRMRETQKELDELDVQLETAMTRLREYKLLAA